MIPYDILNVSRDSSDEQIRNAYLKLVRKYPPDTAQDQFKKINNAYSQIKDEKSRIEYYLFNTKTEYNHPMEALLEHFNQKDKRRPPDYTAMKQFLKECAD